jgi:hypothetical protein
LKHGKNLQRVMLFKENRHQMTRTQRFIACAGISPPLFSSPPLPPLPPSSFFRVFCSGKTGGAGRRKKITRRQQTCFYMIVEQGHKLLKGPIVRSNRVWFGHTFKKFYIDRQTRVFYFFGIPSVSTITMSYNWTWSTRSIFLAGKKRIFFYGPPLLT